MKMRSKVNGCATAVLCWAASISALAWDGVIAGKVGTVEVTNAGNYPFRVYLASGLALCGNTNNWAYLSDADGNYKVNVGIIMTAKVTGASVTLYSNRDVSTGYCKIGYVSMQ